MTSQFPAWVRGWPCSREELLVRWARVNRVGFPPSPFEVAKGTYKEYLTGAHWRNFRGRVLVLADCTCARCGGEAREVHHKTYERIGKERLDDVEPLCRGCHENEHGKGTLPLAECMKNLFAEIERRNP